MPAGRNWVSVPKRGELFLFVFPLGLLVLGQWAAQKGARGGALPPGWWRRPDLLLTAASPIKWYCLSYLAMLCRGGVWLVVLRRFPLSYAYPVMSLGYVLIFLLSLVVFGDTPGPGGIAGSLLILFGVACIHRGEKVNRLKNGENVPVVLKGNADVH